LSLYLTKQITEPIKIDDFETKTGKVIFFCLIAAVPAFVVIFALITGFFGPSSREIMTEMYSQETIHGVVDSIYNDTKNHNVRMVILTDKTAHEVQDQWVINIEKGDSISKNKGSFIFDVYH
jgi:hypothetical protein